MIVIYLFYGLAFFALGLAALLESRRESALLLGRQLPWLAAFGLSHSMVEWSEMLLLTEITPAATAIVDALHIILLPLSALLLIRFGVGLVSESGPLPRWLLLFPVVLIVPAVLIAAYALVVTLTEPNVQVASDIWSRYLLFIPGSLLAAAGFLRQSREAPLPQSNKVRNMMRGAALAFVAYALFAGLVVPSAPYGLAPWLNYDLIQQATGLPVQLWRTLVALGVTVFVVRALSVFDFERKRQLDLLADKRKMAEETLRQSELRFRNIFEFAPIGMDIVSAEGRPIKANRALQQMLGYSEEELRSMVFADYTHPEDTEQSLRLTTEVREGKRESFQMEKRYLRKDGQVVFARVTVSSIRDSEGRFSHFIAMVEDITERRKAEEMLQRERERAQQAQLNIQTEARRTAEGWVNTLVEIGRRIAHMESIDTVLLHIIAKAHEMLQSDIATMALFDDFGQNLQLKYQATASRAYALNATYTVKNDALISMLRGGSAARFPQDVPVDRVTWHCPTVSKEIKAAAVAPLQFDGQVVGGIWAARFSPRPFTSAHLFGLENLADQAVIALQHASMAAQLQSVATLEERSRIAREMHDGLAQILGYLGIQMQTIEAYVRRDEKEQVLAQIEETRENIKVAQADVRENILSLRTTLAGEAGLVPALREYVEEFGVQFGTEAQFVSAVANAPNLAPLAEVQLVRIVQEALTNVRKHAHAGRVQVTLLKEDKGLAITVTDDGVGFEADGGGRHFGLQTMTERAVSVGGRLNIHSTPDQGTEVALWLPLLDE